MSYVIPKKAIKLISKLESMQKGDFAMIALHCLFRKVLSIFLGCVVVVYSYAVSIDTIKTYMPYQEFKQKFKLGSASTEKLNPHTAKLSQVMHKDLVQGLELLLSVEQAVIHGYEQHITHLCTVLVPQLKISLQQKGRIFLVGSGSSGRLAIDLAAKAKICSPELGSNVISIIAGGDAAIVRAKEGFEDSEADGKAAIAYVNVTSHDTVILISGSGSASFNVGCGQHAADSGAAVYYFYNSTQVPERTVQLFNRKTNPVIPLLVDIGPQAIAGSTRLQAATLAIVCLGTALFKAFKQEDSTESCASDIANGMRIALTKIHEQLPAIQKIIDSQVRAFSNPHSNFRQLQDIFMCGYVTMIATPCAIREAFIDTSETAPTFSTNPLRRESECKKKRAEFQAYVCGTPDNATAWECLLGRSLNVEHKAEAMQFLIAAEGNGNNSYINRPKGNGNVVIGIIKLPHDMDYVDTLLKALQDTKQEGADTSIIVLASYKLSHIQRQVFTELCDVAVLLEDIPLDAYGLIDTCALKMILNLISNGSMVLMNKVYGNRMIDVNPSNNKLIDRAMRLISEIWQEAFPRKTIDDETLYHYVQQLQAQKKTRQEEGLYTPSVVNMGLNLLYHNKTPDDFDEMMKIITANQERLDFLDAGH